MIEEHGIVWDISGDVCENCGEPLEQYTKGNYPGGRPTMSTYMGYIRHQDEMGIHDHDPNKITQTLKCQKCQHVFNRHGYRKCVCGWSKWDNPNMTVVEMGGEQFKKDMDFLVDIIRKDEEVVKITRELDPEWNKKHPEKDLVGTFMQYQVGLKVGQGIPKEKMAEFYGQVNPGPRLIPTEKELDLKWLEGARDNRVVKPFTEQEQEWMKGCVEILEATAKIDGNVQKFSPNEEDTYELSGVEQVSIVAVHVKIED